MWLNNGDKNTNFFHAFAKGRRDYNSIWRIEEDGTVLHSSEDIRKGAIRNFKEMFKASEPGHHEEQIWAVEGFPLTFDERERTDFYKPINREEILTVLNSFSKDKSPGPDGWTPDFFIHFSKIFIDYTTEMAEEARKPGKVRGALNSTFLVLIPKKDQEIYFNDYRPISLYNTLYKIVSMTIGDRLKGVLSIYISPQQLGFLKNRSIHDAVATTQEVIHSIHT